MTPDTCRAFASYNRWMNDKLFATAASLSDEERKRDCHAFFGSIHRTLNHLLVADRIWLGRLNGVQQPPGFLADGIRAIDQELFSDFDELRRERQQTDAALETWAASVSADALVGTLHMTFRGNALELPLWWAVTQLFNHQTHHRGQITTLLTQANRDVGSTDIFAMLLASR